MVSQVCAYVQTHQVIYIKHGLDFVYQFYVNKAVKAQQQVVYFMSQWSPGTSCLLSQGWTQAAFELGSLSVSLVSPSITFVFLLCSQIPAKWFPIGGSSGSEFGSVVWRLDGL